MGAFEAMTAVEPVFWEWSAGVPVLPEEGGLYSAEEPQTFRWITDLVSEEPASRQGSSFSGVAFLLRFSSAGEEILNVFTTGLEYADADAWALLAAAGQPLTLVIDSAQFDANQPIEGRGPFTGTRVTFTID